MAKSSQLSAIDIGSSKITCLITVPAADSARINVVGVSTTPSRGIRRGQIVNIEEAVGAITDCVEAAERMAGFNINSAFVSISGDHVQSQNSQGVVAVTNPESEIDQEDIMRVVEAARAVSLPSTREIIHVLPREYIVDSQGGIKDPVGMSGVRLETTAHLVTGSTTAIRNITKCINEIGIEVSGLVYSGLASSYSVLTDTEKELGVVLVDIGGGVTSVSVYVEGSSSYSCVIPVGAKKITDDLAIGLMISLDSAEKIKMHLSEPVRFSEGEKPGDDINLIRLGIQEDIKNLSKKTISEGIIRPRLNEIFTLVGGVIKKSGFAGNTPAGIVITGGGALSASSLESCRRGLQLPARIGKPKALSGLVEEIDTPAYACAVGLVLYGYEKGAASAPSSSNFSKFIKKIPAQGVAHKAIEFIKSFLP